MALVDPPWAAAAALDLALAADAATWGLANVAGAAVGGGVIGAGIVGVLGVENNAPKVKSLVMIYAKLILTFS